MVPGSDGRACKRTIQHLQCSCNGKLPAKPFDGPQHLEHAGPAFDLIVTPATRHQQLIRKHWLSSACPSFEYSPA